MHGGRRLDALERMMRPVFSELKAVGIEARRASEGCLSPGETGDHDSSGPGASTMEQAPLLNNGALTPPPLPEDRAGGFGGGELLARMADTMRTIRAADGRLYAAVSHDGRLECYRLDSDEFRRLLFRLSHDATGTVPKQAVVTNVLATLRSRAENSTDVQPVYLRVARDESGTAFVVDLGDADRRAVSVSAGGWEVVGHPGVPFWRPPGQRAFSCAGARRFD